MEHGHYVIRGGTEGRERLRILSRVMHPTTQSLLERVGLAPGMACLDVGCGGGDVTVELARLVGPAGRVVGIDIDEPQIELARREAAERRLQNVEFRVGEVPESGAEFDLVYARFLLTHLSDPGATVARMHALLRPGGLTVLEDIDFSGHFCHPDQPDFRRYLALYTAVVRRRGGDPDIGPRLPGLLLDAGHRDVRMNVVQPAGMHGEVKLITAITMESIVDAVLADGLASQSELEGVIERLYAVAEDGRTVMSVPRVVQAWGRRAAVPA